MKPIDPRLIRRSAAVRRHLVAAIVLGVVVAGLLVAQAWAISEVVARYFGGRAVTGVAIAAVAAIAGRGLLGWAQTVVAAQAAARVKADLRAEVIEDLLDPRRVGARPSSARTINLLGNGLDALDAYIGRFLPQVVLAAVVPGVVVAVMLFADLWSGVIVAFTLPLIIVFLVLVGLRTQDEIGRRWRAVDRLGRHFADVLDGIVVLASFGRNQAEGIRQTGDKHRVETVRSLRVAFTSAVALDLFSTLSVALVAVEVGLRLVYGDISLATGLFVLILAPEAFLPVRKLGAHFHDSTEGVDAVNAVMEVLDHPRHPGSKESPDPRREAIELADVQVQYDDRAQPALEIDRLVILPGVVTAITGPSGCGKSTLLSLLLGLQLPSQGHIDVAGVDLTEVDPQRWREHVAWVPQVPGVVAGTVTDNVRFGLDDAEVSDVEVAAALRDAGAADLAPDRVLGESGVDVSAGERRRIAVARAVLRARRGVASLVLLDEPTAGLDADREEQVIDTLRSLNVTVVLVSHRAATLAATDRVVTLANSTTAVQA